MVAIFFDKDSQLISKSFFYVFLFFLRNVQQQETAAARVAWWARFDSQGAKDLAPFAASAADESSWTKAPPAELKGLLKRGIAWNRFHFNVPESWANEELNLLIDALKGSDETYLDGVKIGEKTNVGETSRRAYACRVAKGGKHVVALRMKCVLPPGGMGAGIFLENARTRELIGVEETRELHAQAPDIKVIILTSYGTSDELRQAIANGAAGALMKDAAADDLLAAIRTVAAGGTVRTDGLGEPTSATLGENYLTILSLVAQGFSNPDIARNLGLSEITIKKHLSAIYRKLGVANRAEAVALALREGIIRNSPSR